MLKNMLTLFLSLSLSLCLCLPNKRSLQAQISQKTYQQYCKKRKGYLMYPKLASTTLNTRYPLLSFPAFSPPLYNFLPYSQHCFIATDDVATKEAFSTARTIRESIDKGAHNQQCYLNSMPSELIANMSRYTLNGAGLVKHPLLLHSTTTITSHSLSQHRTTRLSITSYLMAGKSFLKKNYMKPLPPYSLLQAATKVRFPHASHPSLTHSTPKFSSGTNHK